MNQAVDLVQPGESRQRKEILSITDLNSSNIDFQTCTSDDRIKKILLEESGVFVSADGIVFTTGLNLDAFKKIRVLAGKIYPKWDYRVTKEEIISHLKIVSGLIKNNVEKAKPLEDEKASDAQAHFKATVSYAASTGVSDIHLMIRPEGKKSAVMFRRFGRLAQEDKYNHLSRDMLTAMIRAAINFDANTKGGDANKAFSFEVPIDAQVPVTIESNGVTQTIRTRINSIPAGNNSCKVAIRLLAVNSHEKVKTLHQNGFSAAHTELISQAVEYPFGAIFFTGPTGSGKSTAIAAALDLVSSERSVVTLEQPIENVIDKQNIVQCPVDPDNPETSWENLLRSTLRNDPDVIMIGEIRDPAVAKTATRAATTGHLVLTTLHVNTALEVPAALEHYGLGLPVIAERTFIRAIVAQRLLPRLCDHCKIPFASINSDLPNIKRLKIFFENQIGSVYTRNHIGCEECVHGISGRVLIAEVIKMDYSGRQFILERKSDEWRMYLKSKGWQDMKDHAETKIRSGLVCPIATESEVLTPYGVDSVQDDFDYAEFEKELS